MPTADRGPRRPSDRSGAWAVGPQASEWIHPPALDIREQVPIERLLDQIAQFPTYDEGWLKGYEALAL